MCNFVVENGKRQHILIFLRNISVHAGQTATERFIIIAPSNNLRRPRYGYASMNWAILDNLLKQICSHLSLFSSESVFHLPSQVTGEWSKPMSEDFTYVVSSFIDRESQDHEEVMTWKRSAYCWAFLTAMYRWQRARKVVLLWFACWAPYQAVEQTVNFQAYRTPLRLCAITNDIRPVKATWTWLMLYFYQDFSLLDFFGDFDQRNIYLKSFSKATMTNIVWALLLT